MNPEISRRKFLKLGVAGASAFALELFLDESTKLADTGPILDYLHPLSNKVRQRRAQRAERDNLFYKRVDRDLNKDRINILLFVWGETHEPPSVERATIGSHSIISIDTGTKLLDKISWTHDIRSPEVEGFLAEKGQPFLQPKKIDQAYFEGGFDLMQKTVESATGLAVDFQIACSDEIIVDLVDKVYGRIKINNPKRFKAYPIYYKEEKYPEETFEEGLLYADGLRALYYIKSVPINDGDPQIEHNQRKYRVIDSLKEQTSDILVYLKFLRFLQQKTNEGVLRLDFKPGDLFFNLEGVTSLFQAGITALTNRSLKKIMPNNGHDIYLVDPAHGDGGVQWIAANAAFNPITESDFASGVYNRDSGYEVPFQQNTRFLVNPYSDNLIDDYWHPMRQRIKELLQRGIT